MTETNIITAQPVTVSLADLQSGACDEMLPDAFGPESLGIIVVKGLPAKFKDLRTKVLSSASHLAALPADKLKALEDPTAHWLNGWSLGKEVLSNGLPDDMKGSYYVNCSFYGYPGLNGPPKELLKGYENYREYTNPGIWPSEEDLKGFERDLKELCKLMIGVAETVAEAVDRLFGGKLEGYPEGYLKHIVRTSTTTKARLLHYFAPTEDMVKAANARGDDSWCGEHFDFSCLTALTSALFADETDPQNLACPPGSSLLELPGSPDPNAGLYIRDRRGRAVKVAIPRDCLAFQTGSALQEATSNKFKAVPHYVRGSNVANICRNTLAVFCQPSLHEPVGPRFKDFATYSKKILEEIH